MNGGSVTEISTTAGGFYRYLSGGLYDFGSNPLAIAFDGQHVWVADGDVSAVTEINPADGSWLRTASGRLFGLGDPAGLAVAGGRVWVPNQAANTVTELPPG